MFNESLKENYTNYYINHYLTISILLIILIIFSKIAPKIKNSKYGDKIFRYGISILLVLSEVVFHIWRYKTNNYNIHEMLPFTGFCSMLHVLTIIYLVTNNKKLATASLYFSAIGPTLALMFVNMNPFYAFPHFRFFHYYLAHFIYVLASLYYYFTKQTNVNKKDFLLTLKYTLIYTVFVYIYNIVFKTNGFFLMSSPVMAINKIFIKFKFIYTILWLGFILSIFYLVHLLLIFISNKALKKFEYIQNDKIYQRM